MTTPDLNNQKHTPFYMAACLWILTNIVFGVGCAVFTVVTQDADEAWMCFFVTLATLITTLPVLMVLTFTFSSIWDLPLGALDKIKRLLLTCYGCTLPYALIGANIYTSSYNNPHFWSQYLVQVLYQSAILFACSLAGILIINKTILKFFSTENEMIADQQHN